MALEAERGGSLFLLVQSGRLRRRLTQALDVMNLLPSHQESIPEKHRYITLIEYSLSNEKFSIDQACNACNLSEKEFRFVASSIYALSAAQADPGHDTSKQFDWIISPEAYFSYLQYLEFRHSIASSKRSFVISVVAVILAIVSTGISLAHR